jgi:NADH:ubiquinone oxidoreductase subunit 6 (subunit J)
MEAIELRTVIFHLAAIIACAMAVWAITRRHAFSAILALTASLAVLGVASLAIGAYALGVTQILVHAGGVFVLLLAGLLLADEGGAEVVGTVREPLSFIGIGAAFLLGVAIAVKFTPLTDRALDVAPLSWRELAGQVIAGGVPGETFVAVALAGLLAVGTILGIRLATRAEHDGKSSAATGSSDVKKADG